MQKTTSGVGRLAPVGHHANPGPGRPFDYKDSGTDNYGIDEKVNPLETEKKQRRRVGKPQTVRPEAPNIVSTWRDIATQSATLTEALETMNKALGMKLTHSRIAQWEQEEKAPSGRVVNYMLSVVVPVLLLEQGAGEPSAKAFSEKIRIPGL